MPTAIAQHKTTFGHWRGQQIQYMWADTEACM